METINENITSCLSEEDVGITQFLNTSNPGFFGILKHRYSDFLVNEIDLDGNVVWLKPSPDFKEAIAAKTAPVDQLNTLTEEEIEERIKTDFTFLPEEDRNKLNTFLLKIVNKEVNNDDTINITYLQNKDQRKLFHETIRKHFGFLDSETTDNPNDKRIVLFLCKNKTTFNKKRKVFPDTTKKNLFFSMLKRNIDTGGAINFLARMMRRTAKNFKYAGNKDKRGITCQKICLFNTLPDELQNAQKSKFWDKRIEIASYEFRDQELRLGMLKGNQFCLVLRFINKEIDDSVIKEAIEAIEKNGFITYFGMQRFGTGRIPTHQIGILTLKKQWKDVLLHILDPKLEQIKDNLSFKNKEEVFENLEEVINKLPSNAYSERKMLLSLKKAGKNAYQQGFSGLTKQLQVLYPHAYQSYVWNQTVSERIKLHGTKILIGDIVKKKKDSSSNGAVNALELAEDDDEIEEIDDKDEQIGSNGLTLDVDEIFNENYEYITEVNIGNYGINDVVIPIVGYKIKFPKNDTAEIITNIMKKDEITMENFLSSNVQFNSTGYFRKIIEKQFNLKYSIVYHDNPDEDLQTEYYNYMEHPDPKGSKFKSLRIQFSLPQSTYATMFIRELTKKSSAFNVQSQYSKDILASLTKD